MAFDTVNHEILLLELDKMKIKGNELRSFKDYLTNRRQLFEINGEVSLFQDVTNRCSSRISFRSNVIYYLYQ